MNDVDLTLQTAAKYLGMTSSGLDYYSRKGRGPERKLVEIPGRPKKYHYKKEHLDEWRRQNPTAGFQRNKSSVKSVSKDRVVQIQSPSNQIQSLSNETIEQYENKISYLEQELERALDEASILQKIIMILGKEIK